MRVPLGVAAFSIIGAYSPSVCAFAPFLVETQRWHTLHDFAPPAADRLRTTNLHMSSEQVELPPSAPIVVKPVPAQAAAAASAVADTFALNAILLGILVFAAATGLLHNDVQKLAALPANADHFKATATMLRDLPTEWLAWYDDEALQFPLMTKAATSGICYFIGDICAQGFSGKDLSTLQLERAARSGAAGFIGHGPIAHYWLEFLDKYLSFGGAWWAVAPKIIIDQGPMSIVYNTIYSLLIGAFAFRDPREVLEDVKKAFVPGFLASVKFWPAVHLVTFSVIPTELQLLWIDVAEIVWICILSQVNNEGIGHGVPNAETQLNTTDDR